MKTRKAYVAAAFLLIAAVLFGLSVWAGQSGEVLSVPIMLSQGATLERDFHVPFSENYNVTIQFARVLPYNDLRELLSGENVIDATISQRGNSIPMRKFFPPARSSSSDTSDFGNLSFANDWIAQMIGMFSAKRGIQYHLSCNVLRTDAELVKTNPTVTIAESDPLSRLAPTAVLLLASILSALIGAITGIVYLFQLRKTRSYAQNKLERH